MLAEQADFFRTRPPRLLSNYNDRFRIWNKLQIPTGDWCIGAFSCSDGETKLETLLLNILFYGVFRI